MQEKQKIRIQSETLEARDARLKILRENQSVRTESETSEERDKAQKIAE